MVDKEDKEEDLSNIAEQIRLLGLQWENIRQTIPIDVSAPSATSAPLPRTSTFNSQPMQQPSLSSFTPPPPPSFQSEPQHRPLPTPDSPSPSTESNDQDSLTRKLSLLSSVASSSSSAVPSNDQMLNRLNALRTHAPVPAPAKKTTIDIVYLIDLTRSMQPLFDRAKNEITTIVNSIKEKYPDSVLRMGFVGYRDFDEYGRNSDYEVRDFCTPEELRSYMDNQVGRCEGGCDPAEDFIGGFKEVLGLDWKSKTRLCFMVMDAPGHGFEFHDMGKKHDRYYNTPDPNGHSPADMKELVRTLCNKNIDLYTFRLNDVTDKFESAIKEHLKKFGCVLTVLRLGDLEKNERGELCGSALDRILPQIMMSIDSSVMRSNWG